jgi:hypothetical protein
VNQVVDQEPPPPPGSDLLMVALHGWLLSGRLWEPLQPLLPAWLEVPLLRIPDILDFHDAFFLKFRSGRLRWLSPLLRGKFDQLLCGAAAVSAGVGGVSATSRGRADFA